MRKTQVGMACLALASVLAWMAWHGLQFGAEPRLEPETAVGLGGGERGGIDGEGGIRGDMRQREEGADLPVPESGDGMDGGDLARTAAEAGAVEAAIFEGAAIEEPGAPDGMPSRRYGGLADP